MASLISKAYYLFLLFVQIKKMFSLADKDRDGKLSVAEWQEMLVKAGAPADQWVDTWSLREWDSKNNVTFKTFWRKEIEKFFAERDRDFDGRLSLEEFLGEETQIEKLFRLMDKNKDGYVTKKVIFTWKSRVKNIQLK